jgi:amino acid permease
MPQAADGATLSLYASEEQATGSSFGSGVLNLTNTLLGGGIAFIALPLATKQVGVPLMAGLVILSMVANIFTMTLLVKCAEMTGKGTYFELGDAALGKWRHLVTVFIFLNNFGVCVAFIATFGDVFPEINWGVEFLASRANCVIVITLVLLLPMLTLKNLDSLRFLSACSIVLCLFFVGIVVVSAADVHGPPPVVHVGSETTFVGFLQALSVITLAFTCHYNVLPIRTESCRPTDIRAIVNVSTAAVSVLYCVVGALAFYCHPDTKGDILSDFSTTIGGIDPSTFFVPAHSNTHAHLGAATTVARLGVAIALMLTFPLIASEGVHCAGALVQAAVGAMATDKHSQPFDVEKHHRLLALLFTLLASVPGAVGADTGAIIGFVGAFCGIPIMYLFPALFFLQLSEHEKDGSAALPHSLGHTRLFSQVVVVVGVVCFLLCVVGAVLEF